MDGPCDGVKILKPWGFERILAETDFYVFKEIVIDPGKQKSLHYHVTKIETVFVVRGPLTLVFVHCPGGGEDPTVLNEGHCAQIEPGVIHRFRNRNNYPVHLLQASSPHIKDVVRVADDYGRARTL